MYFVSLATISVSRKAYKLYNFFVEQDDGSLTSVSFKSDALLFQKSLDFFVVGDNAVMYNGEFVVGVGAMRMAVQLRRLTMSSPSGMCL